MRVMKLLYSMDEPNPNLLYFSGISLPGFSIPERKTVYSHEMYRHEIEKAGWTFRPWKDLGRLRGAYETDFDFPYHAFKSISHLKLVNRREQWLEQRMVKSRFELKVLKKACAETLKIWRRIRDEVEAGMTELEISGLVLHEIRKSGFRESFQPVVSQFPEPHHIASRSKAGKKPLIIDFGIRYRNYVSDISRTLWMGRSIERKFERAFSIVDGWKGSIASLDRAIRKIMDYPHATGHGIGLAVHEWPVISGKWEGGFKNGMVFTIEPAIYGRRSARIENEFFYEDGIHLLCLDEPVE